jgi:hypothetical protein
MRILNNALSQWLLHEAPFSGPPLCDFDRLRHEIRHGDVLLIEGCSRVSNVIKTITQSPWSHSCLYIGRINEIDDPVLQERMREAFPCEAQEQLIIESLLGVGTIISPLSTYQTSHVRVCRPRSLSRKDAQSVMASCIRCVGHSYDVRQLFDLLRFFFPWQIMPRRWQTSLFNSNVGASTRAVCSTVIAEAFQSVKFPVLPLLAITEDNRVELVHHSSRLFTPRDFDYSPFFDIIKFPFIDLVARGYYNALPWNKDGMISDGKEVIDPLAPPKQSELLSKFLKKIPKRAHRPQNDPFEK